MAKTIKKAPDPYRWNASSWSTAQQYKKWERVGMRADVSLDDLELNWVNQSVRDLKVKGAIEEFTFDRTIEGASTVTVTMRDPHMHIFNEAAGRSRPRIDSRTKLVPLDQAWQPITMTDLIERAVDIILDDVHFRLVKVHYNSGTYQVQLTFEDRIIYWLRRKEGILKTSRNEVTRAEFILRLLREIEAEKVPFICPQLHQKQLVAKEKDTDVADDPDSDSSGFTKSQAVTVKHVKATSEQRRNMATVLDEAKKAKGSTRKSLKAAVVAVIQESAVKNLSGGDRDSRGILQVRDSTAAPLHLNNRDIRACVKHFMLHGFWGKGGAVEVAKKNPHQSAAWVAQQVQGSGVPDAYAKWSLEADRWLDVWDGGKTEEGGGTYVKSYQYSRDKGENSWDAMLRLAEEVNWRIFPVGNAMYFMSEADLFRRRVRHVLSPDSDEFIDLDVDMDWGKPVNEMTMRVELGRWDAPPGSVINLDGFGPPDGRWLVVSSSRNWFSPVAELTLHQPGEAKREPAHERQSRAKDSKDGGGKTLENTIIGSPVPGIPPHSPTHQTAGLPGYPAYDYMAKAGTPCVAPMNGKIARLSGKDPSAGGPPGGALGYSIYLNGTNGKSYFMTHLDKVKVRVNQEVKHGEQIAVVAKGPPSWSTPHVHMGVRG